MRLLFFLPILFLNVFLHGADSSSFISEWPPVKGRIALLKHENRFSLHDGIHEKVIRPELVSKQLRSLDDAKLVALLKSGNAYVKVSQCTDGEFTLDLATRTYGGGPGGAFAGAIIGETVGKGGALLAGYAILYTVKGFIHVTAGREAAHAYENHIIQVSIPHLHQVAEIIGHTAGGIGAVGGGLSPLP